MKLIKFKGHNVVFAENQPEYLPLPAHINKSDQYGRMTCCWKLSVWERLVTLFTGKIWHQVLTFHCPLQPQLLLTKKPEL